MKFKNICLAASILVVVLSCFLMLVDGQIVAAATPVKSVLTLQQQTVTDRFGNESIVLAAKMTKEDGYPLSERTIAFFETHDIFGKSLVPIGTAITSAVGVATVRYETKQLGQHTISASFSGDAEALPAEVTTTFDITDLSSMQVDSPPAAIQKITYWVTIAVYTMLAAVFVFLISILLGVIRGVAGNGIVR